MTLRRTDGPIPKPEPSPKEKRARMRQVSPKRRAVNVLRSAFVREQLAMRPWCEAGPRIGRSMVNKVIPTTGNQLSNAAAFGGCYWLCGRKSVELHEPLTRSRAPGDETILSHGNSVAVCRACHTWVHAHPADAERIGLLLSSRGKS